MLMHSPPTPVGWVPHTPLNNNQASPLSCIHSPTTKSLHSTLPELCIICGFHFFSFLVQNKRLEWLQVWVSCVLPKPSKKADKTLLETLKGPLLWLHLASEQVVFPDLNTRALEDACTSSTPWLAKDNFLIEQRIWKPWKLSCRESFNLGAHRGFFPWGKTWLTPKHPLLGAEVLLGATCKFPGCKWQSTEA